MSAKGTFKVKNIVELDKLKVGDSIPSSDAMNFFRDSAVQFEYLPPDELQIEKTPLKPGIFSIDYVGQALAFVPTSYTKDSIMKEYCYTEQIRNTAECFFNNIDIYLKLGDEVPKRGCLLFGPAGGSKSTSLKVLANEYVADGKTAIVIWPTDRIESHAIKSFLKRVDYQVERMIFVIEDIGGVEAEGVQVNSDPSLLAILDNQEKSFKVPTYIIATTNYPEAFMENLTNRPGRFDDQVEVTYPPVEQRIKLLEFFADTLVKKAGLEHLLILTDDDRRFMEQNQFEKFTAAHIRELVVKSLTHGLTLKECANKMLDQQALVLKRFSKRQSMGGWN